MYALLGASLRFGLGALGVSIIVLVQEYLRDKKDAGSQFFQVYESGEEILPVSKAELHKERLDATLAGMEVGGWYSIAFIAQAIALLEVDASKVSSWKVVTDRRMLPPFPDPHALVFCRALFSMPRQSLLSPSWMLASRAKKSVSLVPSLSLWPRLGWGSCSLAVAR